MTCENRGHCRPVRGEPRRYDLRRECCCRALLELHDSKSRPGTLRVIAGVAPAIASRLSAWAAGLPEKPAPADARRRPRATTTGGSHGNT